MAKQDPFAKNDGKNGINGKEEFIDFGDPNKSSKSGSSNVLKIIIAVLVLGAVVGGGIYFLYQNGDDTTNVAETAKKSPTKTVKAKPPVDRQADMAPKPLPAMDMPINKVDPAPKLETPAMPSRQDNTAPVAAMNTMPPPNPLSRTVEEAPKREMPKPETRPTTLPKMTKSEMEAQYQDETTEDADVPVGTTPTLHSPPNGAYRNYDESSAVAQFTWSGDGNAWIAFSRSPKMTPVELRAKAKGNHYKLPRPVPGVWYWQVGNGAGKSEVRMFTVNAPVKRAVSILEPQDGATLVKDNGTVSWKGDHQITYYRVEMSTQGWANPNYRFATSGNQLQIRNVPQGQYQMRVGAFSEVSGRWEYTDPIKVSIQ